MWKVYVPLVSTCQHKFFNKIFRSFKVELSKFLDIVISHLSNSLNILLSSPLTLRVLSLIDYKKIQAVHDDLLDERPIA